MFLAHMFSVRCGIVWIGNIRPLGASRGRGRSDRERRERDANQSNAMSHASNAVLDIRTPGATEALSDLLVLSVWEVLRRRGASSTAAEIGRSTHTSLPRVHAALDALESLGLVARSSTSSRAPRRSKQAGWMVTRDTIAVGFRRGDQHDRAHIARMSRLFDKERRAGIKGNSKAQPEMLPHEFSYNGMHSAALSPAEHDELLGLLTDLGKFFQRCNLKFDGTRADAPQYCNCHMTVDVEALRAGVLPLPTMQIVDMDLATDLVPTMAQKPLAGLSPRERDVAKRLSSGSTIAVVAKALSLSEHTVRELTRRVYRKLGVSSRAQLGSKLK